MNKDIFEGKWEEIKGQIKKTWGKLTDDDFEQIKGSQQESYGKLQKHYGHSKEQAENAVKEFQKNRKETQKITARPSRHPCPGEGRGRGLQLIAMCYMMGDPSPGLRRGLDDG